MCVRECVCVCVCDLLAISSEATSILNELLELICLHIVE